MTEFDVESERPRRSRKAAAPRTTCRWPIATFALVVFIALAVAYGGMIGKPIGHPIELLYPAAFVIVALLLTPGVSAVAAFYMMLGRPVEPDLFILMIVVAISAVAYGALARHILQHLKAQTP